MSEKQDKILINTDSFKQKLNNIKSTYRKNKPTITIKQSLTIALH